MLEFAASKIKHPSSRLKFNPYYKAKLHNCLNREIRIDLFNFQARVSS